MPGIRRRAGDARNRELTLKNRRVACQAPNHTAGQKRGTTSSTTFPLRAGIRKKSPGSGSLRTDGCILPYPWEKNKLNFLSPFIIIFIKFLIHYIRSLPLPPTVHPAQAASTSAPAPAADSADARDGGTTALQLLPLGLKALSRDMRQRGHPGGGLASSSRLCGDRVAEMTATGRRSFQDDRSDS